MKVVVSENDWPIWATSRRCSEIFTLKRATYNSCEYAEVGVHFTDPMGGAQLPTLPSGHPSGNTSL